MRKARIAVFIIVALSVVFSIKPSPALMSKGCPATPETMMRILVHSMMAIYNILPIKIGAIPVAPFPAYDNPASWPFPICICWRGPIPVPGLTISFWEPIMIYETVKIPFCFPTIGIDMPISDISKGLLTGTDTEKTMGQAERLIFAQVHELTYPVWKLLDLFTDFICMSGGDDVDVTYVSEVDPFWQNDLLNAIIHDPATILFANPIAILACMADAAAAVVTRPIDVLYWCVGTWGTIYPTTGHAGVRSGVITANVLLANRQLYRSSVSKIITIGSPCVTGTCQPYVAPFWKKTQFSWLELFPVLQSIRMKIGKPPMTWAFGKNPPVPGKGDHFVWQLYRERECCAF